MTFVYDQPCRSITKSQTKSKSPRNGVRGGRKEILNGKWNFLGGVKRGL